MHCNLPKKGLTLLPVSRERYAPPALFFLVVNRSHDLMISSTPCESSMLDGGVERWRGGLLVGNHLFISLWNSKGQIHPNSMTVFSVLQAL